MKNADSPLTPIFQHSESEQAEIGVFGNEKKPKYSFEFERLPLVISKVFHSMIFYQINDIFYQIMKENY